MSKPLSVASAGNFSGKTYFLKPAAPAFSLQAAKFQSSPLMQKKDDGDEPEIPPLPDPYPDFTMPSPPGFDPDAIPGKPKKEDKYKNIDPWDGWLRIPPKGDHFAAAKPRLNDLLAPNTKLPAADPSALRLFLAYMAQDNVVEFAGLGLNAAAWALSPLVNKVWGRLVITNGFHTFTPLIRSTWQALSGLDYKAYENPQGKNLTLSRAALAASILLPMAGMLGAMKFGKLRNLGRLAWRDLKGIALHGEETGVEKWAANKARSAVEKLTPRVHFGQELVFETGEAGLPSWERKTAETEANKLNIFAKRRNADNRQEPSFTYDENKEYFPEEPDEIWNSGPEIVSGKKSGPELYLFRTKNPNLLDGNNRVNSYSYGLEDPKIYEEKLHELALYAAKHGRSPTEIPAIEMGCNGKQFGVVAEAHTHLGLRGSSEIFTAAAEEGARGLFFESKISLTSQQFVDYAKRLLPVLQKNTRQIGEDAFEFRTYINPKKWVNNNIYDDGLKFFRTSINSRRPDAINAPHDLERFIRSDDVGRYLPFTSKEMDLLAKIHHLSRSYKGFEYRTIIDDPIFDREMRAAVEPLFHIEMDVAGRNKYFADTIAERLTGMGMGSFGEAHTNLIYSLPAPQPSLFDKLNPFSRFKPTPFHRWGPLSGNLEVQPVQTLLHDRNIPSFSIDNSGFFDPYTKIFADRPLAFKTAESPLIQFNRFLDKGELKGQHVVIYERFPHDWHIIKSYSP